MKIKVCGMKYHDNILALSKLPIDMMGLIFYDKSPRYVEDSSIRSDKVVKTIKSSINISRVGVFVNEDIEIIKEKINKYELLLVQLHGNESPGFCKRLSRITSVIKAFNIGGAEDLELVKNYEGSCTYFLFDTKTSNYGGSGLKFDWAVLDMYAGKTPFILSGGISIEDIEAIKKIKHPLFYGIDINSRFEMEPGLKDIELLTEFLKKLNS